MHEDRYSEEDFKLDLEIYRKAINRRHFILAEIHEKRMLREIISRANNKLNVDLTEKYKTEWMKSKSHLTQLTKGGYVKTSLLEKGKMEAFAMILDDLAKHDIPRWTDFNELLPRYGELIVVQLPPEQKAMPFFTIFDRNTEWVDGSLWLSFPQNDKQ